MPERDRWYAALGAPPRLPQACPVTVLHLRTVNDTSGNGRYAYVVLEAGTGHVVEVLEGDGTGETQVANRYPWLAHYLREPFGLDPDGRAHVVRVDVSPGEWRSWLRREPFGEPDHPCGKLRARAERCAAFARMASLADDLRVHRDRHVPAWDEVGREAMRRLARAGLARRVHAGANGEGWVAC